jgi:hypothetical protein
MKNDSENFAGLALGKVMTRRNCLRFLLGSLGLFLTLPLVKAAAAAKMNRQTIVDQFLGEELIYNIGFWLISRCGKARTSFVKTDLPGIYRLGLEGHSVGFIDFLVGKLRYDYISYAQFSAGDDRLRPILFQVNRKRAGKERRRSVIFDYAAQEIIFSKAGYDEQTEVQREPMRAERLFEDYLTLFYNFRYGYYGPLNRGTIYQLPLYIRKKMKSLTAQIVDHEQEKKQRKKEADRTEKDFFIKFQVAREDISSGSGRVEGWLSSDTIPIKGTIKDVIFFGDLWGEMLEKRAADPGEIAIVPEDVKTQIRLP